MATRVTVFETHTGIKGKVGFTFKRRYCDECGGEVRSLFSCKCEKCGSSFTDQQFIYEHESKECCV